MEIARAWLARCLAVLVAVCAVAVLAPPAHAVVTPRAFGDCHRAAARHAMLRSDLPALAAQAMAPDFEPFFKHPYFSACRDLNGDGRRDLVVIFGIKFGTASSPVPWAILEVPRGRTEPKTVFLQPRTTYLSLLLRRGYVIERQKTLRPTDPNCCPSGRPTHPVRALDGHPLRVHHPPAA